MEVGILLRIGIVFLISSFTHLIIVVIWNEFFWYYRLTTTGVEGQSIYSMHPLYIIILAVEFFLSFAIIALGMKNKIKQRKEGRKEGN